MTPAPWWLYYAFALAMLAVAAYGLVLLAVSIAARTTAGWDVDVVHIFMGVSMAGMFVSGWAFGPVVAWKLIFGVLLVWFVVRSIQSLVAFGIHLTHYLIHAAMSFAMLLMYSLPAGTRSGSMAMTMASSTSPRGHPGLSFLLALSFFASAIFTLASPNKGASHHGTHGGVHATSGPIGGGSPGLGATVAPESAPAAVRLITAPRLEDLSHVVMCVGMGFMLIVMI